MKFQHKTLAQGRWQQMSFMEQMANIGSEISRAAMWQSKNENERVYNAVSRALELIYLTIEHLQKIKRSPAIREMTRLREVICDYFLASNEYNTDIKSLMLYFDQFAIAYAIKKEKQRQPAD
jgi:hypothetical protein